MTKEEKIINDIISEDRRRLLSMDAPFDPVTGQGSVGDRFLLELPDHPLPKQWLPVSMRDIPLVGMLIQLKSVAALLRKIGTVPDEAAIEMVVEELSRVRMLHDFPYWAACFVYIQRKGGGGECLFRLTYPQRKLVSLLESMRIAGKPIRVILLKARQWGGSTTIQIYMSWLQLVHSKGLNSLIVCQVRDASLKIKEMFRRMINAYPPELIADHADSIGNDGTALVRVGGSDSTQSLPARQCSISVGTAEEPDSVRAGDYSLVHLSEVGLWKSTQMRTPEDIVRAACSGVLYRPYTMIVYESTANGVGNFFHREYTAAKEVDIKSQFAPLFVAWHDIELYRIPFDSDDHRREFARWLYSRREMLSAMSEREEPGRYLWWLWQQGATLEGIHWYIEERAKYNDHGQMAAEYPSDDNEAFVNSGNRVFDKILVDRMRASCRPPRLIGELSAKADAGDDALVDIRFSPDGQGRLWVWDEPEASEPGDPVSVVDRYLVVVDIGGRGDKADWSVIAVFDRLLMMDGQGPVVVAQWRGHCDMDVLAWKAAQIAAWYDNALLVIESNTIETHERDRRVEGDQSAFLLQQIRDSYLNLYARRQSEADIREGLPRKYGFHTNTATKPMIISTLVKVVRDGLYTERDTRCLDELINYERRQNGSFGAIIGEHDDMLMTRAIGLHISFHEMDTPRIIHNEAPERAHYKPFSEASIL